MNRPFSISWGPSRNAIVLFQTSLCRYIPLFALHILSSDWFSWRAGCFSRHPWIPLIHPSFKSCHVCRHFSFYPLTNLTPWGYELRRIPWDGEITIRSRAPVTKEGFAESCTSVLHFRMVLPEVGLWVMGWDSMTWPIFTVPVRNWELDFLDVLEEVLRSFT